MLNNIDFNKLLKEKRLKVTGGRLAVLKTIEELARPADVTEIIVGLKKIKSDIDQATVYRNLDRLTENGILLKVQFREDKFRYEINIGDHHHLVCDKCGQVEVIEDCPVGAIYDTVLKKQGFKITHHSLEFFGLCKQCR